LATAKTASETTKKQGDPHRALTITQNACSPGHVFAAFSHFLPDYAPGHTASALGNDKQANIRWDRTTKIVGSRNVFSSTREKR